MISWEATHPLDLAPRYTRPLTRLFLQFGTSKHLPLIWLDVPYCVPVKQTLTAEAKTAETGKSRKNLRPSQHRSSLEIQSIFPRWRRYGVLNQITMSCLCTLSRQVAGAGAGCRCWVLVVGAGCACGGHRVPGAGRRCWVPGAGVVSWRCTWWKQGAGCRCRALAARVVETGCRMPVLGAGCARVPVLAGCWLCAWWRQGDGAGVGAVSWLCTWWRQGASAGRWVP